MARSSNKLTRHIERPGHQIREPVQVSVALNNKNNACETQQSDDDSTKKHPALMKDIKKKRKKFKKNGKGSKFIQNHVEKEFQALLSAKGGGATDEKCNISKKCNEAPKREPTDHETDETLSKVKLEQKSDCQREVKEEADCEIKLEAELKNKDSARSDEKDDDPDLSKQNRLQRTLFVGNVSLKANARDVRKLFLKHGPIEAVRIRNVIPENPKIPKKVALLAKRIAKFADSYSAYVVFAKFSNVAQAMKNACIEHHLTLLKDKHIRVTPAVVKRTGPVRCSAFIGNIPYTCTEEELIMTFAPIAKKLETRLLNVRLNRDEDTGICRGTGFVSFDDEVAIQSLINMSGEIKIRSNVLRLSRAQKSSNKLSKTYKRRVWHKRKSAGSRNTERSNSKVLTKKFNN